jgi:membrane protein DedA with SNARE-associated domain
MVGMEAHIFDLLREYFQRYGYWTVVFMLLLENTGVPVPGEATLLFASFLAYSEHRLQLPIIVAVGIAAAMVGDNTGYAIGYFGGRPLVNKYLHFLHIRHETIQWGETFFVIHGASAIFWGRFIAGLRILAGPLAGTLRMPWRRFVVFNFLGATAWVLLIATLGYLFETQLDRLLRVIREANLVIVAILLSGVAFWYWKRQRVRAIEARPDTQMSSRESERDASDDKVLPF